MRRAVILTTVCLTATLGCFGQDPDRQRDRADPRRGEGEIVESIPAGSQVQIRTDSSIDVKEHSDGRIYTGTVEQDVYGPSNRLLIPRGARAEMIVQNTGDHEMALDLDSITVGDRRYMVDSEIYRQSRRSGVGANERTGKYVGGGAVFGTILGAIAGGGKGAAIGAIAGAAAGGGLQTATRGRKVYIPAEAVLTFRLDQPLQVAREPYDRDRGYDDNGNHYHNGYYDRGKQ